MFSQLSGNFQRAGIQHTEQAEEVFSYILNALLYINSDKRLVGFDIVISPLLVNNNNKGAEKTEERKYRNQWIVRGHGRNQVYGERLSERKLIWIEPYIKGDSDSVLVNRNYTVE